MIHFDSIHDPVFLHGDRIVAYRDPAAHYHEGTFRVFHTQVHREDDGRFFLYTAVTQSRDLVSWTPPRILTPRDQRLNYSSPGNIIRYGGRWFLCLQTYPTPENQPCGDDTARVFVMSSDDLEQWTEPRMLMVKGPDVPVGKMGRMIDPYLVEDKDEPGTWWCFYKQHGASMSHTRDFETWTYSGRTNAGENVCVLVENDEYVMFHSPANGVGIKRSKDLAEWSDGPLLRLRQDLWPWAQGRLTAGHVLDLRHEPGIGKYIMFFHGASKEGCEERETHGHACLAFAWSEDMVHWAWPGR